MDKSKPKKDRQLLIDITIQPKIGTYFYSPLRLEELALI